MKTTMIMSVVTLVVLAVTGYVIILLIMAL